MGEVKPLQINPIKLSQPMGAMLAFLGVKNCMPLMHGAQGCASFTKVFMTRHFSEPIAVQTTAVSDITAVLDGGDYSITESIKNITKKVKPELVGLFTTGLTETKGDDIRGVTNNLADVQQMVYVHTPDFEGGLESGWALSVEAMIKQLTREKSESNANKVTLLPNVNLKPIEVEKIKDALSLFGMEVCALPDLSESLDGHLGVKQGGLSNNGISVEEIKSLGDSAIVISIGESMQKAAKALQSKNETMLHWHFDTLGGLEKSDAFYGKLIEYRGIATPHPSIVRWRKRLQDALLDTHFRLGGLKVLIADEPDAIASLSSTITEAGTKVTYAFASQKSDILETIEAKNIEVGDLDDVEKVIDEIDVLITNFHGERLAHKYHKKLMLCGFPNYEEVGNQLKNGVLYEGSCYTLFELANLVGHGH